jgi:hypothetical protein
MYIYKSNNIIIQSTVMKHLGLGSEILFINNLHSRRIKNTLILSTPNLPHFGTSLLQQMLFLIFLPLITANEFYFQEQ